MASKIYDKIWETEFIYFVLKKYEVQDNYIYHLKLEIIDTYRKTKKITTIFKPSND